jgi:hypothetical protein
MRRLTRGRLRRRECLLLLIFDQITSSRPLICDGRSASLRPTPPRVLLPPRSPPPPLPSSFCQSTLRWITSTSNLLFAGSHRPARSDFFCLICSSMARTAHASTPNNLLLAFLRCQCHARPAQAPVVCCWKSRKSRPFLGIFFAWLF